MKHARRGVEEKIVTAYRSFVRYALLVTVGFLVGSYLGAAWGWGQ